jgi:phosphoribosylformylglycinamidine synthase
VDLEAERRLQRFLVEAARQGLLRSAHDCAEGGLLVAIAEAALGPPYAAEGLGATLDLTGYAARGIALEALLFGEDAGRVVTSVAPDLAEDLASLARAHAVPAYRAGRVADPAGALELRVGGSLFSWVVPDLRRIYFEAIPRRMQHPDVDRSAGV